MDVKVAPGKQPEVRIQSVGRAFRLLELVAAADGIGVTELSSRTGLPTSTVHNLLFALGQLGYVTSEAGRYRLGPATMLLTAQFDAANSVAGVLTPALEQISHLTGHSATATILIGQHARTLQHREGGGEILVRPTAVVWQDPLALATGRLLVALHRRPEWQAFIAASADRRSPDTAARWMKALAVMADGELAVRVSRRPDAGGPVVTAVAVSVEAGRSRPPISIGVAVPWHVTGTELHDLVATVWSQAGELSTALGMGRSTAPTPAAIDEAADIAVGLAAAPPRLPHS